MILLLALLAGLMIGISGAHFSRRTYQVPGLRLVWVVFLAFLPQFLCFYLPQTRSHIPDEIASASLVVSQGLLLVFALANHRLAGMWVLVGGLVLNLAVILSNSGFMPISPETAEHLLPAGILQPAMFGERFGSGKDILLLPEHTQLAWLSDRFLLPAWVRYQVAFSLGDIFIGAGIFWLLSTEGKPLFVVKRRNDHVTNPIDQSICLRRTDPNRP